MIEIAVLRIPLRHEVGRFIALSHFNGFTQRVILDSLAQRSDLQAARNSIARSCGCSHAAK